MAHSTTTEELKSWMAQPEGRLEFKEAKGNYDFGKLLEYVVALANEGGGKVVLGVTDKRPRTIVGTAAFQEPDRTEAGLYERLNQRIPIEELVTTDGRVLVVHVPPRLPGMAWQVAGRYLKRAGDSIAPIDHQELAAIFTETGPDFSAEVCRGAVAGLSSQAIRDFRDRWAIGSRDERKRDWTDDETLASAELTIDGQPTYAAVILFGTSSTLNRFLPQAEIIFEYRSSEASGRAADRREYREGFFLIHDALWDVVNLRNDRQSYQDGLFRKELLTFDEISIREALLNAVAHRDYRLGGSIFVRQSGQRLEVISPGGFPAGVTTENILEQQNPRNRRLAEALGRCGLIERSGQGVNLMFERAVRDSKGLPSFEGTSGHEVRLTLEGAVTSPEFVRYLERVGEVRLQSFSTYDFLVLDSIRRGRPIAEHMRGRVPRLIDLGVVESVGQGRGTRYTLSRSLYAALGAAGTYTRSRGLDRETNKALLEQHIRNCGDMGAPLGELRQVLPAVSDRTVQTLLRELRASGKVWVDGQRRWARWRIGPGSEA